MPEDTMTLSREAIAPIDPSGQLEEVLACPSTCATPCGAWSRRS